MSASLIVMAPLVLLGVVTTLCFVGCALSTGGLPATPFTDYRSTVLGNDNLVAFWPLDDPDQSAKAAEPRSGFVGDYVTVTSNKDQFPDPALPNVSAPAFGKLAWQQAGIVAGDCINNDATKPTACIVVNGGYVSVPQHAELNPPSFTVEAWVRVDWNNTDMTNFPPAFRLVVDSRAFAGANVTGFALFATPENLWAVSVGGGAAGQTILTGEAVAFNTNKPVYLAVTYDGGSQTLTLFVNGMPSVPALTGVPYVQNTTSALFIGSGAPSFPLRPQPPAVPLDQTAPLFPFVGALEDVAIYNIALPHGTMDANDAIFTHAQNGNGSSVG
jgi:Concanavalin A-like lectin/glucanases superfamily